MAKVPKWARKPQMMVAHSSSTYCSAAKLLEIEAGFCRQVGNRDGARALARAAEAFRQMGSNAAAPDAAFGWPEETTSGVQPSDGGQQA